MTNQETKDLIIDAIERADRIIARNKIILDDFYGHIYDCDPARFDRLAVSVESTQAGIRSSDRKDIYVAMQLIVYYWPAETARAVVECGVALLDDPDDDFVILATDLLKKALSSSRNREVLDDLTTVIQDLDRSASVRCAAYCAACDINGISPDYWLSVAIDEDTSRFEMSLIR